MTDRQLRITFGPPGTGKTTAMLNRVEDLLKQGIAPQKIAFVSYTKKAVTEAAERAAERFSMSPRAFCNFRTVHSTAYQALGIARNEMMGRGDYKTIGELLGVKFTWRTNIADGVNIGDDTGDYMLQLCNLSNATGESLRDIWQSVDRDLDWYKLKQFHSTMMQYKADTGKLDFDDLLIRFSKERPCINVDAAIIDEAQDLSNAQWNVVKTAFRKARFIDVAGDDDQCIYHWSGANVERFLKLKGETNILNQSYRIPATVHSLAGKIIKQVHGRRKKQWAPREEQGSINYLTDPQQLKFNKGESYLLLARNSFFLTDFEEACTMAGVPYKYRGTPAIDPDHVRAIILWERRRAGKLLTFTPEQKAVVDPFRLPVAADVPWFDGLGKIPVQKVEYYLSVLRSGYRLQDDPLIEINTIHGVKGGEADNVVLRTDMTTRSYDSMQVNADNEHRVFYVGATRTRNNLHIIQPTTTRGYLI